MSNEDLIFKNSALYMKSLIGKEIEIITVDNKNHSGTVYVIDPIFKTVVLHKNWKNDDDVETVLILNHAIKSLRVVSDQIKENYLIDTPVATTENTDKKSIVKKWLKHMMIDVKESGDYLKIEDHLVIMPPYEVENCICNNTIILERIQNLLKAMPQNFL